MCRYRADADCLCSGIKRVPDRYGQAKAGGKRLRTSAAFVAENRIHIRIVPIIVPVAQRGESAGAPLRRRTMFRMRQMRHRMHVRLRIAGGRPLSLGERCGRRGAEPRHH